MIRTIYSLLETKTPRVVKELIPEPWRVSLGYKIKVEWPERRNGHGRPATSLAGALPPEDTPPPSGTPLPIEETPSLDAIFHPLELPPGESEESLRTLLSGYYVKGEGITSERQAYLDIAFKRLLYTLQLTPRRKGTLLEIGAAPYYMSLLLQLYTPHDVTLVNYFGESWGDKANQTLICPDGSELLMESDNVNIETERLPYDDASFDVVLFCEVIEHLVNDPYRALLEIKRVLTPDGALVLTTPNVAQVENIERLMAGINVYDDYSAYGPYGRHNREYTLDEIRRLLEHAGFTIEQAFTSDSHGHIYGGYLPPAVLARLSERREELGQYLFVRARNSHEANAKKPLWLFRSYQEHEVE